MTTKRGLLEAAKEVIAELGWGEDGTERHRQDRRQNKVK